MLDFRFGRRNAPSVFARRCIIMHSDWICIYLVISFTVVVLYTGFIYPCLMPSLKNARFCKGITNKGKMRALGQMRAVRLVFLPFIPF